MLKKLVIISIMIITAVTAFSQVRSRSLNFENPGTRRLLKTSAGNHYYYYRSLPERPMTLRVEGLRSIELRSFATEPQRSAKVTVIIGRNRTEYTLTKSSSLNEWDIYNPVIIDIPNSTQSVDVLCYSRNIYFRAFYTPEPRIRARRTPNLSVASHAGIIPMAHNGNSSNYYTFTSQQSMRFTINNGRNVDLYVRARLLDREPAVFELYKGDTMLGRYEFDIRRTTRYTVQGVSSLSIGKKLVITGGNGDYTLKAVSNHLFFAKPVIKRNP